MDVILASVGVTRGALYYQLDDKEALGYGVVDEVAASLTREKWGRPLQNVKNPIDTLTPHCSVHISEARRSPARLSAE